MKTQNLHKAKPWTDKADCDLKAASELLSIHSESLEVVCFLCQQAAEKYLKAVMALHSMDIPKTHKLPMLMKLLMDLLPERRELQKDSAWLSEFAVATRYPSQSGLAITCTHAERASAIAQEIKILCETQLISVNAKRKSASSLNPEHRTPITDHR